MYITLDHTYIIKQERERKKWKKCEKIKTLIFKRRTYLDWWWQFWIAWNLSISFVILHLSCNLNDLSDLKNLSSSFLYSLSLKFEAIWNSKKFKFRKLWERRRRGPFAHTMSVLFRITCDLRLFFVDLIVVIVVV